jgi:hypothetical protein
MSTSQSYKGTEALSTKYPADWGKCPLCKRPTLDGKVPQGTAEQLRKPDTSIVVGAFRGVLLTCSHPRVIGTWCQTCGASLIDGVWTYPDLDIV